MRIETPQQPVDDCYISLQRLPVLVWRLSVNIVGLAAASFIE